MILKGNKLSKVIYISYRFTGRNWTYKMVKRRKTRRNKKKLLKHRFWVRIDLINVPSNYW